MSESDDRGQQAVLARLSIEQDALRQEFVAQSRENRVVVDKLRDSTHTSFRDLHVKLNEIQLDILGRDRDREKDHALLRQRVGWMSGGISSGVTAILIVAWTAIKHFFLEE